MEELLEELHDYVVECEVFGKRLPFIVGALQGRTKMGSHGRLTRVGQSGFQNV
jgi:hypothetical protein